MLVVAACENLRSFACGDQPEEMRLLVLNNLQSSLRYDRFRNVNHGTDVEHCQITAGFEHTDHLIDGLLAILCLCANVVQRKTGYDDIETGVLKGQMPRIHLLIGDLIRYAFGPGIFEENAA